MKHILVTGGSSGIGKEIAKRLVDDGFKVTILSQDAVRTKAVAKATGCEYVVADVSDIKQVKSAVTKAQKQSGAIDVLINNAGLWAQGPLEGNDPEGIKRLIEVNTTGTILCAQAVIPTMKKQGNGRIINVSSQAGLYAKAERAPYNASKWAVTGFSKALRDELKPFNISVTGFYPSAINDTNLFAAAGLKRKITTGVDPSVIADAIAYICKLPDGINVPEMGIEALSY